MSNTAPIAIKYVGDKPVKRDTVCNTGTLWAGKGDVQIVDHKVGVQLLQFPTVWVKADAKTSKEAMAQNKDTVSDAKKAGEIPPEKPAETPASTPAAPVVPDTNPEGGEATVADISAAIGRLDPGNKKHFSPSNKPMKAAVEAELPGKAVAMKALNAAWKEFQGK